MNTQTPELIIAEPLLLLSHPWGDRYIPWFAERLGIAVEVLDRSPQQLQRADLLAGATRQALVLDREALESLTRCQFVQIAGVGLDHVDLEAADELGLPVANSGDANAVAVSEWTVMAILTLLQGSFARHEMLRAGGWELSTGSELRDKCVGVIGMGRIGRRVAELVAAFGATVAAYDIDESSVLPWRRLSLDALLAEADVVSLHVPLCAATRHLIDEGALARMKSRAVLVNASRGGVVDEMALADALGERRIAGAALDVFEQEPLPSESLLRKLPNVLLSPHAAAMTYETGRRTRDVAAANLAKVLRGEEPDSVVTRTRRPRRLST